MTYYTFWHVTLCGLGWASRPVVANRVYSWNKVVHNVCYAVVRVVVWVCFENVFAFLWVTSRLDYMQDEEALATVSGGV